MKPLINKEKKYTLLLKTLFITSVMLIALYLLISQTGARMFWPFMIITYIIAIPVYLYEVNRRKDGSVQKGLFNYFFSKDLWFHKSAIHDYFIILINLGMITLFFKFIIFKPDFFFYLSQAILSLLPVAAGAESNAPSTFIIALYTLATFVLADLSYYIAHRLQHKVPWLWEFHKVHHSAKVMTPATLHRAHPVDVWMSVCFRTAGLGIASGIFYYFHPNLEGFMTIMGVNALLIGSYVVGANLRHSHIWLPFGPKLEHVFMSPAQHQIHHSEQVKHYDKNFGSFFTVWDWMFGSLYVLNGKEQLTFGLGSKKQEEELNTVWKLYVRPFQNSFKILAKKFKTNKDNKSV